MESLLSSSQDNLIHGLDFSISSNTASYVEERSERQFMASSNHFSPSGVRTIRINVAGNEFIDLSSLLLVGMLHNDDGTHALQPLTCGIHGMISRFTVYISGSKAEDILHYGRTTEMFLRMMPEAVRRNLAAASGFGAIAGSSDGNDFDPGTLAGNSAVRFTHKPILSGICNCGKYMPLQFLGSGGLVLEWELGGFLDGIQHTTTDPKTLSERWHISDVRVQASVINLNSQLQEAYAAHVLSGKSLMIPYKTFTCTSSALPDSNDHDSSIARNFTRLCTLFQTFTRESTTQIKDVNNFHCPVAATQQDNFQSVLQIGSKRWSEFDRTGLGQHFCYLLQASGYFNSLVSSLNISLAAYRDNSFIAAWDLEKVPQAIMSGYNTSGGQTITASWKDFGTASGNRPKKTFFVAHYDAVLELASTSAQIHS